MVSIIMAMLMIMALVITMMMLQVFKLTRGLHVRRLPLLRVGRGEQPHQHPCGKDAMTESRSIAFYGPMGIRIIRMIAFYGPIEIRIIRIVAFYVPIEIKIIRMNKDVIRQEV